MENAYGLRRIRCDTVFYPCRWTQYSSTDKTMIEGMSYFLNTGSYISSAPMFVTSHKLFLSDYLWPKSQLYFTIIASNMIDHR